jgi:hypothetical protein
MKCKIKQIRRAILTISLLALTCISTITYAQDVYINQNTTWSSNQQINGNLYITAGRLTINNGANIDFINSSTNRIIISPDAELWAFGVTFKSTTGIWWGITMDGMGSNYDQFGAVNGVKQPKVILSRCEVNNAQVCVSNHLMGDPYTRTGGYIIATNTTFYDFHYIGIDFARYTYVDPSNNIINDNSRITKCTFYAKNHTNAVGINMNEVQNIQVKGCHFENIAKGEIYFTGIRVIKSSLIAKAYEQVIPPNTKVPNEFINCAKGIYLSNMNIPIRTSIIRDNIFTNNKDGAVRVAIEAISTANLEILNNEINIAKPQYYTGKGEQFGIHLTGCSGFHIEGNVISAVDLGKGSPTNTFGILINNSGGQSNEIYRNTISSCHYNIQAINKNRGLDEGIPGSNDKGLRFFCNTLDNDAFSDNFYISAEIVPANNNFITDPTYGVAVNQAGAINNSPTSPNFNEMTGRTLPTGSEKDFFNMHQTVNAWSDLRDVFYMEPKLNQNYTWYYLEYYTGHNNNAGIPNHVYPQKHISIDLGTPHCESRIPIESPLINEIVDEMNTAKTNFTGALSQFNAYANNGNHGYMLLEANSIDASNYIWIYYDMLNNHPSSDVLAVVAAKEAMPAAYVTDILIANPYGIKHNQVRVALENRIDALNSSQWNSIYTASQGISYYEELQLNISHYDDLYRRFYNKAADYYLREDTLFTDVNEIVNLHASDNDIQAELYLIMHYYEQFDASNVANHRNNFEQLVEDSYEQADAATLLDILDLVYFNYNGDYSQLGTGEVADLHELAKHRTIAAGIALSILDIHFNVQYPMLWADLSASSLRKAKPEIAISNEKDENIHFYPNPTSNSININFDDTQLPLEVNIYDLSGKLILQESVTESSEIIDIQGLENGLYLIKFTNKSKEIIQQSKLIINR